jgi:thioredoxin reductase (NADPH)
MDQFRAQANHVGADVVEDVVTAVDLSARPFRATGDSGDTYLGDAVVVATGAQARWLGIPGERELSGFGVSACATCDGFFFRGRNVAVVGGGNTAVEEALYLSGLAAQVTVIHRRDRFRAERILQERLQAKGNVRVLWNTVAEAVLGTEGKLRSVRALALRDARTGERTEAPFDGVFVAIGHDPATALFRGQVAMDEGGYIRTEPGTARTSVEGVFAAGDVQDRIYRQAVTAAGTGCMAALDAEKWLAHMPADAPAVEAWT